FISGNYPLMKTEDGRRGNAARVAGRVMARRDGPKDRGHSCPRRWIRDRELTCFSPVTSLFVGRSRSRRLTVRHAHDPFSGQAPWQFLYFLPLPQGQGSFRPTLGNSRRTVTLGNCGSAAACPPEAGPLAVTVVRICGPAAGAAASVSGPVTRAVLESCASMFSKTWMFDALRNRPVQICTRTLTMSSSKYL